MESFSYLSSQNDKITFTWATRTTGEALGGMMSGLDTHDITDHSRLGLVTNLQFVFLFLVNYMLEFQM